MEVKESPCKACSKAGCGVYHDICEKYQSYKAYKEAQYEKRKKSFLFNNDLDHINNMHLKRKRDRRVKHQK